MGDVTGNNKAFLRHQIKAMHDMVFALFVDFPVATTKISDFFLWELST